tara:strand:- start:226 stop:609 length:384 start_codon:yes stop_codon:yes gene_type:complete
MQRRFSRLISIPFFLASILFFPVASREGNLKNNYPTNISCTDEQNIVQDFEGSFDKNLVLIDRINEKTNIIDFFGIGPSQYPENRMVQESKKMWDTFECYLSRFTEKYKPKTKDVFNGYNSSLSNLE